MTLEGRFTFKHESPATPSAESATPTSPFVSEPASSMATPTSYTSHGFQQQHNSFMSFPKKEFGTPTGVGGAGAASSSGMTDFYQPPPGSTFQPFTSSGNEFGGEPPRSMYDHSDASGHAPTPSLTHPLALSTMRSIRRGPFAAQTGSSQELSR